MGSDKGYPGSPLTVFHGANPTLIPNFDSPAVAADGRGNVPTVAMLSPEAIIEAQGAGASVGHLVVSGEIFAGDGSFTLGGTVTENDSIALVFTNAGIAGSPKTITVVAGAEDTLADIAAALVDGILADSALVNTWKITAEVDGTTPEKVNLTQQHALQDDTVMSYTKGGNSETITFTDTGHFVGGYGPITDGDAIDLIFTNGSLPDSPVTISLTIDADVHTTYDLIASALHALIDASVTLASWGISAAIHGDNAAQLDITQSSPVGQATVMSYTQGTNSEILTFTDSGSLTGAGGVIIPYNNFEFVHNGITLCFWIGKPVVVDHQLLEALIAAGAPIK